MGASPRPHLLCEAREEGADPNRPSLRGGAGLVYRRPLWSGSITFLIWPRVVRVKNDLERLHGLAVACQESDVQKLHQLWVRVLLDEEPVRNSPEQVTRAIRLIPDVLALVERSSALLKSSYPQQYDVMYAPIVRRIGVMFDPIRARDPVNGHQTDLTVAVHALAVAATHAGSECVVDVDELLASIRDLRQSLESAEGVDTEVRLLVNTYLERAQSSLSRYKIGGYEAVREELRRELGGLVIALGEHPEPIADDGLKERLVSHVRLLSMRFQVAVATSLGNETGKLLMGAL